MNNYQVLQEALDKATQRGSFNLKETGVIMKALVGLGSDLKELEELREEGAEEKSKSTKTLKPTK